MLHGLFGGKHRLLLLVDLPMIYLRIYLPCNYARLTLYTYAFTPLAGLVDPSL
jgi:hypothetical protein